MKRRKISIRDIQEVTAREYGISVADMLGPRRSRPVLEPRQIAMWLVCDIMPHKSLPQIGKAFDRDHTTVLHGKRRARILIARTQLHIDAVRAIIAELKYLSGFNRASSLNALPSGPLVWPKRYPTPLRQLGRSPRPVMRLTFS